MRTRRNVWTLPQGDPTLVWYAKAVGAMQALPIANPLSWRYQAAVHGYPGAANDPLAQPGQEMPSASDQATYWDQCQHASSFFLPWHRMYLHYFEQIVTARIVAMGGPADWSLPYWDYSTNAAWRLLPLAFQSPSLPDGSANPLHVQRRNSSANQGQSVLDDNDVDLSACLQAPGTTATGGFFGPPPANHVGGGSEPFGALETTPHNAVHVEVGSDAVVGGQAAEGWMLDPDLAALDPIFWLHHANIDRLWQVWLNRDPSHANLTSQYWLTGVPFAFHDATGAAASMVTQQVLDTMQPPLGYIYEDTSDPLAAPQALRRAGPPVTSHELVGATLGSVELGTDPVHVRLPTPVSPTSFAARAGAPGAAVQTAIQHVTLRLEHMTSKHPAPVYDVYINVPSPDAPTKDRSYFVGRAAMFGIAKASRPGGPHGGGGVSFAFDVTSLYKRLVANKEIDPTHLRVSFVPIRSRKDATVRVGRVSLYFG